jgi:hypothetical protein
MKFRGSPSLSSTSATRLPTKKGCHLFQRTASQPRAYASLLNIFSGYSSPQPCQGPNCPRNACHPLCCFALLPRRP